MIKPNELNGIILFVSESCKICSKQKELYNKIGIKFKEIVCDHDPNYFIETFGIDLLPETRIYESGNLVWKRVDIVHEETDIEFLRNYI